MTPVQFAGHLLVIWIISKLAAQVDKTESKTYCLSVGRITPKDTSWDSGVLLKNTHRSEKLL
jgi:hypothetical protein